MFSIIAILLAINTACNTNKQDIEKYIAIHNRDTAYLTLNRSGQDFFGKYKIVHPGYAVDSGDIRGKIIGDTLTGDFYYYTYGWAEKQRKPFALLQKDDYLLLGKGAHYIYFGIPYYKPGTHNFDDTTFVFRKEYK